MKFKSAAFTQVSGSIGGMTFSHNQGGLYTRSRTIPTNPNSPEQATVRLLMGQLSNIWVNTLTDAQRTAWSSYAELVELTGVLGDALRISGLSMYVRSNLPRLQAGMTRIDAAPTIFDLGDFTEPTLSITAPATGSMAFNIADDWPGEDDSAMLVYTSRPVNPTVNFFKGPYRFAAALLGDTAIPLTTPQALTAAFVSVAGQRVFYHVRVTRADGRLSQPFRTFDVVA